MGVFDYISVDYPLPVDRPAPQNPEFQTQDTDAQYLERYTLTADGRLIHHTVRRVKTPTDQLPYPDIPVIGSITSIPDGDVEVPFHGDLEFHHLDTSTREWWSYVARFTEGRCVRIWCDEYRGAASPSPSPEVDHG